MIKKTINTAKVVKHVRRFLLILVVFLVFIFIVANIVFANRVLPNTYFAGQNLAFKTTNDAQALIDDRIESFASQKIAFDAGSSKLEASVADLGISFDKQQSDKIVFRLQNNNFLEKQFNIASSFVRVSKLMPTYDVDASKLTTYFDQNFAYLEKKALNPNIVFSSLKVELTNSSSGIVVDRQAVIVDLADRVNFLSHSPVVLTLVADVPAVGDEGAKDAYAQVTRLLGQTVNLTFRYEKWSLSGAKLFELLTFQPSNISEQKTTIKFGRSDIEVLKPNVKTDENAYLKIALNEEKVTEFVEQVAAQIDQKTADATLVFDGTKVTSFTPAVDGQVVDREAFKKTLLEKLLQEPVAKTIAFELPVKIAKAKIANPQVNALGIREHLASGVSYFAGSIPNRAFNIGLGASLVTGTIVAPGDVFSFNAQVGAVSAEQGFKQAYVINKGRTVLDDGGGICQVSTTVFRAALNAGFPIVKRTAHAYRVGYYEQHGFKPGLDATIFSPSVDLQFKNDTANHILVQAVVDRANAKLTVDIYGTNDGRRVELAEPVVSNITPAPDPLYQDDPTLPKGTTKQVDFAAQGATASFTRKVYKGNTQIIDETIRSNFRPWQAVYLVGTGG